MLFISGFGNIMIADSLGVFSGLVLAGEMGFKKRFQEPNFTVVPHT